MNMYEHYEIAEDGSITGIKGLSTSFETTTLNGPECHSPIQNLQPQQYLEANSN
jgi:hypothetical protein